MKKYLQISIVALVLLITSMSCDSGVENEDIPIEKLYSVSSIISPQDSLFKLHLFKASEIGGSTLLSRAIVADASVIISDKENNRDTLKFNEENERYEGAKTHVTIEPLGIYILKVVIPSGVVLTASCQIPPTPGELVLDGTREDEDYYFTASWENEEAYKYFILSVDAEGTYLNNSHNGPDTLNVYAYLLDDVLFPLSTQKEFNSFDGYLPGAYRVENAELIVTLSNIEQSLYLYFNDYQKYDVWDSNNTGNLFPNFMPVQPIYSNIDGGIGIFAGVNKKRLTKEF